MTESPAARLAALVVEWRKRAEWLDQPCSENGQDQAMRLRACADALEALQAEPAARTIADLQQASRLLRQAAARRQREAGRWTAEEQAHVDLANRLEALQAEPAASPRCICGHRQTDHRDESFACSAPVCACFEYREPEAAVLGPIATDRLQQAAWCGNSVYHDDYIPGVYDVRCKACQRSLLAIRSLVAALQSENVLSSPMAAGLVLQLKAECEAQHARAEAAEQQFAALTAERDTLKIELDQFQRVNEQAQRGFNIVLIRSADPQRYGHDDSLVRFVDYDALRSDFDSLLEHHLATERSHAAARLRASRTMRIFEPSMDGYTAAVATYEAAFGTEPLMDDALVKAEQQIAALTADRESIAEMLHDQEAANIVLMALIEDWTARAHAAESRAEAAEAALND